MTGAAIDVSAVIVNLNSHAFLEGCLDSLYSAQWGECRFEAIVVDNGSDDGSLELLRRKYPQVRVLANRENVGFSRACNQGAEIARGRYVLLLNNDILILADAVARLAAFLDSHPEASMIGSRLLNPDGSDQFSSGRTFPTPMNALFGRKSILTRLFPNAPFARGYLLSGQVNNEAAYEVDWLSAAAMMVRAEDYRDMGAYPEDFYYFSEIVMCWRAKQKGYRVFLDPKSKIIHFEGSGGGVRTQRVRRLHVRRFHEGAFAWFCLRHGLGRMHPLRYVAGGLLWLRAASLMALETIRPMKHEETKQLSAGRPEAGTSI